jgi:hypothetical protein
MWYAPAMVEGDDEERAFWINHLFSVEYLRDWHGKRPPLVVVLPSGLPFCVDHRFSQHNGKKGPQPGWTVTGEAPHLTLTPSINEVGRYHGFLTNGVLSDDLDGHSY